MHSKKYSWNEGKERGAGGGLAMYRVHVSPLSPALSPSSLHGTPPRRGLPPWNPRSANIKTPLQYEHLYPKTNTWAIIASRGQINVKAQLDGL